MSSGESAIKPQTDVDSPGAALKQARENLGLTADDVASELRLSAYQIRALESDEYEMLPGLTYVRGYLRAYARLVNLDESQVQPQIVVEETETPTATTEPEVATPTADRSVRVATLALSLVLVGLVALWWYGREEGLVTLVEGQSQPGGDAAQVAAGWRSGTLGPQSRVIRLQPGADQSSSATRLVVHFDDTAWVDIRDGADQQLVQQSFPKGRSVAVDGQPPFRVFVGNAGSVRLDYAGAPVDIAARQTGLYARFVLGDSAPAEQ